MKTDFERVQEMQGNQLQFEAIMRAVRHITDKLPQAEVEADLIGWYGFSPEQASTTYKAASYTIAQQQALALEDDLQDYADADGEWPL